MRWYDSRFLSLADLKFQFAGIPIHVRARVSVKGLKSDLSKGAY